MRKIEYYINKASLEEWNREKPTDQDRILEEAKAEIRKCHNKELAGKVAEIIKGLKLTKKQLHIFTVFVECGGYRETARETNVSHVYVQKVIANIQIRVKRKME